MNVLVTGGVKEYIGCRSCVADFTCTPQSACDATSEPPHHAHGAARGCRHSLVGSLANCTAASLTFPGLAPAADGCVRCPDSRIKDPVSKKCVSCAEAFPGCLQCSTTSYACRTCDTVRMVV